MISSQLPATHAKRVPRTVLVTGGAGALGFAIAQRLGTDRTVALVDIGDNVAERAAALPDAIGLSCDLADSASLNTAYREVVRQLGPVGVVVHAAGAARVDPFLDCDRANFEEALAINVTAAFEIFRLAGIDLVADGSAGRFISIASVSGARAGFGRTAYGTSKAALIHLMGQISLELGPYGITANAVAPGPVDTAFSRANHTAEQRADYQRTIPLARFGEAEEVAHATAFLAEDQAGYITGQTLFVDGGYMSAGMGVTIAQSAAAIRRGTPAETRHDE
ncbi:SDR family NAD(P)-dependent oxidoreductase [Acuticoccus sp. MNP-M23]|uniref:SDR family NAD(P)-dependent oxidoreductase n=1 Tax=Acuticoccus sp. MNP-M23 TaxID=3072793 RepID=UPI002814C34D|nr:SDR family NAD(P)-dependent oxidoreductase [Acuticoccus sp. MNP-M23]WMS42998.1 SDR family NAD(P)-dependent oxidoreductase [Acuticoccus sp. MNP-M23]